MLKTLGHRPTNSELHSNRPPSFGNDCYCFSVSGRVREPGGGSFLTACVGIDCLSVSGHAPGGYSSPRALEGGTHTTKRGLGGAWVTASAVAVRPMEDVRPTFVQHKRGSAAFVPRESLRRAWPCTSHLPTSWAAAAAARQRTAAAAARQIVADPRRDACAGSAIHMAGTRRPTTLRSQDTGDPTCNLLT
jgi:hypothetical protein